MKRRAFLKASGATAIASATIPFVHASGLQMPVVDAHIHLFDPTRPGGVPWPDKSDAALYRPSLPDRYAQLAEPHGVVGAIAVECSPWIVDNFWLEDLTERSQLMLGFVGNLPPDVGEFEAALGVLHHSPLFLGIRYGNLWNRNLGEALKKTDFMHGLKLLAEAELVLETANPNAELVAAVVRIADRIPDLRIVLDHLPNAVVPSDEGGRRAYDADLRELATRPQIFVKGSEIVHRIDSHVSLDLKIYKDGLDRMWDLFGEDRIFFGSDWPNSDTVANYTDVFRVAESYIQTRSKRAQQKYFWENSRKCYRWKPRNASQQLKWS